MEDVVNGIAKELSRAIGTAVSKDAIVETIRQKAREAGFELRITLEAVIGFKGTVKQVGTALVPVRGGTELAQATVQRAYKISPTDKTILNGLRIATDVDDFQKPL